MELKQWLYNHGDECAWNTGGWMVCKVENTGSLVQGVISSTAMSSVVMTKTSIDYKCTLKVVSTASGGQYYSLRYTSISTFGTKTPLTKDISSYHKLYLNDGTKGTISTFRTGTPNSGSTDIHTSTILQSIGTNINEISMSSNYPYLVVGNYYYMGSNYVGTTNYACNRNHNCTITEIYLV